MQSTPTLIFVYGTLRRDCPSGANQTYLGSANLIDTGKVRGKLYRIEHYPGLIPDPDHWVIGEVYQLPDEKALALLDDYEGSAEHHPEPREYRREKVFVELSNGETLEAWGYYYNWPIYEQRLIKSGDFLYPDV